MDATAVASQRPGRNPSAVAIGVALSRPTRTVEFRPATATTPALELQRSTRRRRGASARVREGRIVVQLPAALPADEEDRIVARLVARVTRRAAAARRGGDDALAARARDLADRYVDGVRPTSVRWSTRMTTLYGSCSLGSGDIRVSAELAAYPDYVLDDVLVHELAHLVVADHGAAFRAIVARHPQHERAAGFLEGVRAAEARLVDPQRLG